MPNQITTFLRRRTRCVPPASRRWTGLGLVLGALAGACSDGATHELLRPEDRASLVPQERARLDALLPVTGPPPRRVDIDAPLPRVPAVRIVDGRLDGLTLARPHDEAPEPETLQVNGLPRLRSLVIDGAWPRIEIDELSSLEELEIHASDSQTPVRIASQPRLQRLLIQGARVEELAPAFPSLQALAIGNANLRSMPAVEAPELSSLDLVGNQIETLRLESIHPKLEVVNVAANRIRSLHDLPELPNLRRLVLTDNPLDPQTSWPLERTPRLARLDLRRTGLTAIPAALADHEGLRLDLDEHIDPSGFLATLERLRRDFVARADARVLALPSKSGRAVDMGGSCTWRTGTHRRAEVRCDLTLDSVDGTVSVRLGETDPALPFAGGGEPRISVRLSVAEGSASILLPMETDLVALARTITSADRDQAEQARRPDDRFEGYAVATARPGSPAELRGDVALLGSRVVFWVSSDAGAEPDLARGLRLTIRPAD